MKALIIGPIVADYDIGYNKSIARALIAFGFQTEMAEFYVTTPPGLINRIRIDGAMQLGDRKHYDKYVLGFNQRVLEMYNTLKPDLVFVIRGSKLLASSLNKMSSAIKVIWFHDSAKRSDITIEQLNLYNKIYVFEAGDMAWLKQTHDIDSQFLPMGFDPETYHPIAAQSKDIDIFFVGKYYPERRVILEQLAHDFKDYRLAFYGRYVRYREPTSWMQYINYGLSGNGKTFINSSLNPSEINQMYSRSKICLNIHHAQSSHGCNPRVYEIMGAGAFQLVDELPYIKETLGDVLVSYTDYTALKNEIKRFLLDNQARDAIAESSRDVALAGHTFTHRVKEILVSCGLAENNI